MIEYLPRDLPLLGDFETGRLAVLCKDARWSPSELVWDATAEPVTELALRVLPGRWRAYARADDFSMRMLVHEREPRALDALFAAAETVGEVIQEAATVAVIDAPARDNAEVAHELNEVITGANLLPTAARASSPAATAPSSSPSPARHPPRPPSSSAAAVSTPARSLAPPPPSSIASTAGTSPASTPTTSGPSSTYDLLQYLDASCSPGSPPPPSLAAPTSCSATTRPSPSPRPSPTPLASRPASAFVDQLCAASEQPGVHVCALEGTGVLAFLAAEFEIARLRAAGLPVRP